MLRRKNCCETNPASRQTVWFINQSKMTVSQEFFLYEEIHCELCNFAEQHGPNGLRSGRPEDADERWRQRREDQIMLLLWTRGTNGFRDGS
jgi:hypothetical protein